MTAQVTERLQQLEREGRLSPNDVVDDARSPDSPLHDYFEWDDTAAAEKYRKVQARQLIRSVKVEVTVHSVPLTVVGYVRDPDVDSHEPGYRNVMQLRTEEDSARIAIVNEMKRVANSVRRAKSIAAVLGFQEDIDRIADIAAGVIERATTQVATEAAA